MKRLDRSIGREVIRRLNKSRGFSDATSFAFSKSLNKPYLVGGKLYRTLIEILYEYPARSISCDYDWATIHAVEDEPVTVEDRGTLQPASLFDTIKFKTPYRVDKKKKRKGGNAKIEIGCICNACMAARISYGTGSYVNNSKKRRTKFRNNFDLIDISTLPSIKDVSIEGYLATVPLSIQSIAMDVETLDIFGSIGIECIKENYVVVNNIESLLEYCANKGVLPDRYIEIKSRSIRFGNEKCPQFIADGHKDLRKVANSHLKKKLSDGVWSIPSVAPSVNPIQWNQWAGAISTTGTIGWSDSIVFTSSTDV